MGDNSHESSKSFETDNNIERIFQYLSSQAANSAIAQDNSLEHDLKQSLSSPPWLEHITFANWPISDQNKTTDTVVKRHLKTTA